MKEYFDEATYEEVVAHKEEGWTSKQTADEMSLDVSDVNEVYGSASYLQYSGKPAIVHPGSSGYFKGLIARKSEENSNLKETRAWLLEQVYFLRRAISFLEARKKELETGVSMLEKNIFIGIEAMERLEKNENFTKVSDSVRKKNK